MPKYKIGIDTLGFENDPKVALDAAINFLKINNDTELVLIANDKLIKKIKEINHPNISYIEAQYFVKQDDPISIIRTRKDFSIQIGCDLLNQNKIDGLISACSTAIFVAITFIKIGTLQNIDKFAFLTTIPTIDENKYIFLLDSGANKSVTAKELYQFAYMANIYVSKTTTLRNPRIGLVNVGTEEYKGFIEHKEANELLKNNKDLNYVGFVETRNMLNNKECDIFVCNGYTGNIILKTLEGSMKTIANFFKNEYKKWFNSFSYLANKHIIKKLSTRFDYKSRAGAFLLGLKKPVLKGHGSSDEKQMYSCIKMMHEALANNIFDIINKEITSNNIKNE